MYCPNCGQQQISDELRFCSRCGLALTGLAGWLAGGALPVKRADDSLIQPLSPRSKAIRRGAKLMFFSGVLAPVFVVISLISDEGVPLLFPVAVFFVALVMMLYARLFGDNTVNTQAPQTYSLGANVAHASLRSVSDTPVTAAARQQVRTNELAQPPSVTENTTRFLDNES